MLISYYANKKRSPRLPSWQPSLIFFNIPIESGTIIKPCTLKHFQVTYMLHKVGYWTIIFYYILKTIITNINYNHLPRGDTAEYQCDQLIQGRVISVNKTSSTDATTVYPKKYAHGFCFAVLCCGYTLTDFPISIRLTSLALWQSNDCPSASKATLMNMDKYFMWIHYERLHNHNKAKHNKTVCIFLGIYCMQYLVIRDCRVLVLRPVRFSRFIALYLWVSARQT